MAAGRPTKYSAEVADKFLQVLRAGNTLKASAEYAGISEDTLARWRARFADFADRVTHAEAEAEVRCVTVITKSINEGNTADAWKWLERRRHDDWRERKSTDIAVTGPIEVKHTVDDTSARLLADLLAVGLARSSGTQTGG